MKFAPDPNKNHSPPALRFGTKPKLLTRNAYAVTEQRRDACLMDRQRSSPSLFRDAVSVTGLRPGFVDRLMHGTPDLIAAADNRTSAQGPPVPLCNSSSFVTATSIAERRLGASRQPAHISYFGMIGRFRRHEIFFAMNSRPYSLLESACLNICRSRTRGQTLLAVTGFDMDLSSQAILSQSWNKDPPSVLSAFRRRSNGGEKLRL
jgi:hypothetical protein